MNYFEQRRAYRDLKMYEMRVSQAQNDLYRELLDYANDKRILDTSFHLMNEAICKLTGLSETTMTEARNRLVQHGLIKYEKGKRNQSTPIYQIIDLCKDRGSSCGKTVDDTVVTSVADSVVTSGTDTGTNLYSTTQQNLTSTKHHHDDGAGNNTVGKSIQNTQGENKAFKDLVTYYQQNVGVTTPVIITNLEYAIKDFQEKGISLEESMDIVKFAIKLTAENRARSWNYTNKILLNWQDNNLLTLNNIKASQKERNRASNGADKVKGTSWEDKSSYSKKHSGLAF